MAIYVQDAPHVRSRAFITYYMYSTYITQHLLPQI